MRHDARTAEADEFRVVRKPLPHDSAARHVAGTAIYVDDIPEPQGILHAALGVTTVAAGRLEAMDLEAVRHAPGVVRVLTQVDIPGANDVSPSDSGDDPVFCDGPVLFHGQIVFAVLAETRRAARDAAALAKLTFSTGAAILTVEDAEAAGSALMPDYVFSRGDVGAAFDAATHVVEDSFAIGGQEHFYLEGQVSLAIPGEGGAMHVHCSTQHPSEVQAAVAHVLARPLGAITVEVRRMGGGFGGKESQAAQWAAIASLGAALTGRPCKVRLDRDDDMVATGKRHDFVARYRLAHDDEGRIEGWDVTYAARCGCSADLSLGVNDRTMFHADNAYYTPAVNILSTRLRTNTVSATAFRGFGGPQGVLAIERAMDHVAHATGIDPLDIRLRNLYGPAPRDVTPYGMSVEDNVLEPLVTTLAASCAYRERRRGIAAYNAESPILRKGLALTPVKFGIAFTLVHLNQAGALVHLYTDGTVHLNHAGTEMGQGLHQKVVQVTAEVFGLPVDAIHIQATNTAKVPNTGPTAASSGTDLNAMAAKNAAEEIVGRLKTFLAADWDVEADAIVFRDGRVRAPGHDEPLIEVAKRGFFRRVQMSATGFYATPGITWNRAEKSGDPFLYFAYGAACSEVTIDTFTGEMQLDRVDILHDVGRSLNPAIDIGQIEGGFVQGLGWLTTEELVWSPEGRLLTHNPATYKIPAIGDIPDAFHTALFENENARPTVHRSKAVGEPPVMLAISAWSAIVDALASLAPGRMPPLGAPATPEEILRAADKMRER